MKSSIEKENNIAEVFLFMIFCFVSLGAGCYVMCRPVVREGLEFLALLPMAFGVSFLLFRREYCYCKGSYGLGLLYTIMAVRYFVTPILIAASGSTVATISAYREDYATAVMVELFELFAVMLAIRVIWPKHIRKKSQLSSYDKRETTFKLTWTGWIFMAMLLALLVLRGHWSNVFEHLSTWFEHEGNNEELYNYDMMAFNMLKVGGFLFIVSLMKSWYNRTDFKFLPVIIALAAGLGNTYYFNYVERTDLFILFLATFFVLAKAFPNSKKAFALIFGFGGILFGFFIFAEGTLHYSAGSSLGSVQLANYSKMAELYTSGPSVLANAHMSYDRIKEEMNFMTYAKDIVSSFDFLYTVPFFRVISNLVKTGHSTTELYVRSLNGLAYILPNYSTSCLYVGNVLGWILEIVFIAATIKLISVCELNMAKQNDLLREYAMVNIVTMFSMGIFCNNFHLMLFASTGLPFWLLAFSYINDFGERFKIKLA